MLENTKCSFPASLRLSNISWFHLPDTHVHQHTSADLIAASSQYSCCQPKTVALALQPQTIHLPPRLSSTCWSCPSTERRQFAQYDTKAPRATRLKANSAVEHLILSSISLRVVGGILILILVLVPLRNKGGCCVLEASTHSPSENAVQGRAHQIPLGFVNFIDSTTQLSRTNAASVCSPAVSPGAAAWYFTYPLVGCK